MGHMVGWEVPGPSLRGSVGVWGSGGVEIGMDSGEEGVPARTGAVARKADVMGAGGPWASRPGPQFAHLYGGWGDARSPL